MEAHAADILLVDDQATSLAALEATLEPLGQRLFKAQSGREALKLLLDRDFAVVLLDVRMPGMDGFETAKLIRERPRSSRTPIIFLTGLDKGGVPEFQAYSLGAVDYLVKPFEPEILRSKVSVFVELSLKTEQVRRALELVRQNEKQEHERVLLRQQVEASANHRAWLEAVLDAMPTPLLLLEPPAMTPMFANRAARGLASGAFADVHGDQVELFDDAGVPLSPAQRPAARLAQGEQLKGQTLRWRYAGQEGELQVHSERLAAAYGRTETLLVSLLDVTDLKRLEHQLRDAVQAREDFLAVGSHELRTPLTAVKFQVRNAQVAWQKSPTGPAKVLNCINEIEKSVDRLVRLSDYLLDVSRLSASKLHLNLAPVDLSSLVREVVKRQAPELTAVGIEVELSVEDDVVGWWDKGRLEQVLSNLIDNARKYAAGARLRLQLTQSGGRALLNVSDQGPGIPPDRLPTIFQRFTRAELPDDARGFGLGLWIVSQLIERHHGTIAVESDASGTRFAIGLPQPQPTSEATASQSSSQLTGSSNTNSASSVSASS
ncbi:MAG: hybrid sensor histidine kinase/response regulator [Myxococcaceae bacterium]